MVATVFLALAVVVALGSALRYLMPDLDVGALRVRINRLVLAVFLPALNFEVIYTASVGKEFWQVPALALAGLAVTLAADALVYSRLPIARPARGALILAGAFGNVTYFGLRVLRGLFPAAVRQVTKTVRPRAIFKHLVDLASFGMLLGVAFTTEAAPPSSVAYRQIDVRDAATGELFPVALWYPTRAVPAPLFLTGSLSECRLPAMLCRLIAFEMQVANNAPPADGKFGFIVISHGAGGLALNHRDLAIALASHGNVVAAPAHPRGKDNDISGVGVWVGRPKQVSSVIDALLEDPDLGSHIQRERIGVVGHSNGGYTALAVAGAKPSPAASVAHCREHPDDSKFCSYGGAATREATQKVGDIPDVRDPRVRAVVLMAPNTAPFTDDALSRVAVPVRLYGAERDDLTLVRYHAERLAKALRRQTEYVLVKQAGHFSFVASFPGVLKLVAGEAAQDPEGFDRDAMHAAMNLEIVDFFDRNLLSGQPTVRR